MTPKLLRISMSLGYMCDRDSMPVSFKLFDWAQMTIGSCIKPHVNTDWDG